MAHGHMGRALGTGPATAFLGRERFQRAGMWFWSMGQDEESHEQIWTRTIRWPPDAKSTVL